MSQPPRGQLPDDTLIERALDGDRDAMDSLLRRHYGRIAAVCRRITADPDDAADCTQEALVAVVRGLASFDRRAAFGTWCYRIATNTCLDELRRRGRRAVPIDDDAIAAARRDSLADEGEVASLRVDMDAALSQLPVEFRVAVVLRDLCGLDYEEIADICGVPGGTVRSRIARGRAALAPLVRPGNQNEVADVEGGGHERRR
jgi:RNA polymerase sigma-70 factor (ECF subfamily)